MGAPPPLPDMSKQRGVFEQDNLKLHLCNGVFEAYSASYLTTKAHMLNGEQHFILLAVCVALSFFHHMLI